MPWPDYGYNNPRQMELPGILPKPRLFRFVATCYDSQDVVHIIEVWALNANTAKLRVANHIAALAKSGKKRIVCRHITKGDPVYV